MPFQKGDLVESGRFAFVRGTGRQREELWPGVVFNKLHELPREYPSRPRNDPADGHVIFFYLPDFEYEVVKVDRLYHEKEVSYIKALASVRTKRLKKKLAEGLAMRMELGGRPGRTREEIASVEAIYPPRKRKGADEAAGSSKARRVVGSSSRRPSRDESSDDSDTDMSDSDVEGASHAVDLSDSDEDEEDDHENDSDYEEEEEVMRGPQDKGKGKQTRTTRANTPFSLDGSGQGAVGLDIPHDTFDDVNLGDDLTEAIGLELIGSVSGASGSLQPAATPAVQTSLARSTDPAATARASSKPTTTAPRKQASSGGGASSSGKKTQAPFSLPSTGVAKGAPGIHAPPSLTGPLHSRGGNRPQPPVTPRHRLLLPSAAPTPVGVCKIADQPRPAAPSSYPNARAGATHSISGAGGGETPTTPQRGAGPRTAGPPIADIGTATSAAMITPGAASPLPASKEPSLSDSATTTAIAPAAREGAGGGHDRASGGSGTESEQSKDSKDNKATGAPDAAPMPRRPSVEEVCQRLWEEAVARAAVAEDASSYRKYTAVVNLLDTPPSRVQRVITVLCRSNFDVDNDVCRRNAVELIYDLQAQQGGV